MSHPRLLPGATAPAFEVDALDGRRIHAGLYRRRTLTLLAFHRYAACPVCSDHLAEFRVRHAELHHADVQVLAFFHSPAEKLRRYLDPRALPFPLIPDPERALYEAYGVVPKASMMLDPRSVLAALKAAAARAPGRAGDVDGTRAMVPADFLVDAGGRLVRVHYGEYLGDSWTVDTVLRHAEEIGRGDGDGRQPGRWPTESNSTGVY